MRKFDFRIPTLD
jgi:hypothetical protein